MMRILTSKATRIYESIAFNTFNVILLILLANLILGGIFLVKDSFQKNEPSVDQRVSGFRELNIDLQAYARLSTAEANAFVDEEMVFMGISMRYEPWIEFRYPEFQGRWLNTDSQGFRRTKAPRSSDNTPVKIFVFGGSTTFGYGVPDDYTIPSYMQTILEARYPQRPIVVNNYGQGFYYSSQELQLFLVLLKKGMIPDYAVFIDGLNDGVRGGGKIIRLGYDEPWLAPEIRRLWDARRGASSTRDRAKEIVTRNDTFIGLIKKLPGSVPMVRLAKSLRARLLSDADQSVENRSAHQDELLRQHGPDEERTAKSIVSIYSANVAILQAICREYGVKCYFIWQPVPFYKYDRKLVRNFPTRADGLYWTKVYSSMETIHLENFLYLGGMLEGVSEKVFVDQVHYNERINEEIARRICDFLGLDHRT